MSTIEILRIVLMAICLVGLPGYFLYMMNKQDKEFAEWQKEQEKRA